MTIEVILAMGLGTLCFALSLGLWLLWAQNRRLGREITAAQEHMAQESRQLSYDLSERDQAQQRQSMTALREMNDSLLNTLNAVTQSQSLQLEAVQRQMVLSATSQEERMDRLYKATEESLKKYDGRMETVSRTLDEKLLQNEQRMERVRETLEGSLSRLQTENAQKLEEMRKTVDEKLHDTLNKRLGESFSQVSQQLEKVYIGLGEMQSLAIGVGDLKRVLTNVKTRGIWGEMQLGALLSQVLAANQYDENVAVIPGSAERVEFAVKLPGHGEETVYLPIDSKFPQEDYLRLVEASQSGDKDACDAARKGLMNQLKVEGKRISGKYIQPPHTTDFAIMFLPIEGLYAEVMRDMAAVELLQRVDRVVIAGPSTLTALLNSLQMGFRTLAIEKRSGEVWKLLGAVKTDFAKFGDVLEKTQQRLRQASDSIDSAFVRTRSIQRQLRQVEALSEGESLRLLEDASDLME